MREQFAQKCMKQKEQVESMETANKVIIVTEVHNPDNECCILLRESS